ncbi:YPDG domain-containing protein [Corynebacterium imitans]|uniref:Long Rib domain-containing protein n=1 Tax=Corynebacterium imitans TaxID=156978 RepID=A0A076NNI8_9CORY|nr:YPDG domain-containing protein [Corynebacterium imitans]AIJ33821.1 hypothetical protein CIMIT_07800 [Corynebacterium imitans]
MKKSQIIRRRGTSVAAAALSFALVAPFAQPVAVAQDVSAAVSEAGSVNAPAQPASGDKDSYDAIYSPGVVNGKKTVSGTVLFYDQFPGSSNGNTAAKGDFGKALPAAGSGVGENFKGATVYAQWFEKPDKGKSGNNPAVASPVYKTTVNEDGTYAINMRPFIDSDGKYREFHAQYNIAAGGRGQKVKIWVDGYDRDEYEMVRGYGERQVPDGTVADTTGGAGWGSGAAQRSLAGAHQVFVKRANAEQMLGDESEWRKMDDTEVAANGKEGGAFYGKAYWNLNQGLAALGQKEVVGDKNDRRIEGLQVVAAYLSDKAVLEIQKHVEENKGTEYQNHDLRSSSWDVNDELKLQAWINEQIAENPDWIAERVVTETDGNGDYLIQFKGTYGINPNKAGKVDPELAGTVADSFADGVFTNNQISGRANAKHVNWDWLFVDAPNLPTGVSNMGAWRGNVWQGLTSNPWGIADIGGVAGTPYDMRGMQKASLSTNYNVGSWDMALMPNQIHFEVDKYDSLTNFARPGDKTHAFTNGLPGFNLSALYQVEWTDSDGNVVNTCKAVDAEGNLIEDEDSLGMPAKSDGSLPNCEITVPEDLDKVMTYTATLYGIDANGDRIALASDSFTALVKTAAEVSPQYDPTFAEVGTEATTGEPKFVDALSGEPIDPADERLADAHYVLHKDALPEGWVADIDAETGVITVTPGANGIDGEELKPGDTVNLPVRVEYADKTANGAYAPIVIGKQADFFEPKYDNKLVVPGEETKSPPTFTDKNGKGVDVPEGSEFAIPEDFQAPEGYTVDIDPATGEITVTVDGVNKDTAEKFDVPVTVTYKDGSTDEVTAPFYLDTDGDGKPDLDEGIKDEDGNVVVEGDDDDDNDGVSDEDEKNQGTDPKDSNSVPSTIKDIEDKSGTVGEPIDSFKIEVDNVPTDGSVKVDGLPDGVTYDPETGEVSGTPEKAGKSTVTVTVLDKDGNPVKGADGKPVTETFEFDVKDKEVPPTPDTTEDKDKYEPEYKPGSGKPGEDVTVDKPDFKDKDGNPTTAPDGTEFTPGDNAPEGVKVDENTGEITVPVPEGATPGDKITVPVEVTYPDGSKDNVDVTVTVDEPDAKDKDADSFEPEYKPGSGKPGEDVTVDKPDFKDKDGNPTTAPDGTEFTPGDNAPEGVKVDENTGEITVPVPEGATPGDKITVPVEVTYPDGSKDNVDVTVTVEDPNSDAAKSVPEYGLTPVEAGKTEKADPFKGKSDVPVKEAEGTPSAGSDDWKFKTDKSSGVVEATAPTYDKVGEKIAEKLPEIQSHEAGKRWDEFVKEFTPFAKPSVDVNFEYNDGSKNSDKADFDLVGKDGKSLLTPDGDFDGDGISNRDEIEKGSNPSNANSVPDTQAPTIDPVAPGDREITGKDDRPNTSISVTIPGVDKPIETTTDENGNWKVDVPSDVELNPGDKITVTDEAGNSAEATVEDTKAPSINEIKPGDKTVSGKGDRPNEEITVTFPGGKTVTTTTDENGNWKVNVPSGVELKPGDKVTATDGAGNKATAQVGIDAGKCAATAVGFGLPLIALIPIGLATQMQIPGLSDFVAQANAQIQAANTQIQQQAGLFNPQLAAQVDAVNQQLGKFGADVATVAGGLALIAAGILAGTLIYDNCSPNGASSSVKDLELKGSSGKTYAGSSKDEKPAKQEGSSEKK